MTDTGSGDVERARRIWDEVGVADAAGRDLDELAPLVHDAEARWPTPEPDECKHEIARVSCAWCAPRPGSVPQVVRAERWFTAKWPGRCAGDCGGWFAAGDEVAVCDGEYFCGRCAE